MPKESPKLISDTFEAHLAKLGKKKEEQNFEKMEKKFQPILDIPKQPQFSPKLETLLKNFNKNDVEKILCLFAFLTKQYGDAFIEKFGQEPDKPFCDVVSKLTQQEIERLKENVSDRLARGSTRIPSHGDLQLLAQRPTTAEIEKAIINIFDKRLTPMNLNRVERFFSENYFHEFNRKSETFYKDFEKRYINTWRSVMLYNVDKNVPIAKNKPKKDGVTFEEHLEENASTLRKLKPILSNQTKSFTVEGIFSPKVELMLESYSAEEVKKILLFWQMMLKAYGAGMKATYGTEPDQHFMDLAVGLTKAQMMRVADNICDLLLREKTFAPAHEALRLLSQRPTRQEITQAMDDLYYRPKPLSELNRVNRYVKKFHSAKISALKMEFFDVAFEKMYVHFWREVEFNNVDEKIESQQGAVKESIANTAATSNDLKVNEDVKSGRAFNHKFGSRIAAMLAEKNESK